MELNVLKIYAQIAALSLVLLGFISELYLSKGNHGNLILKYINHQLFQIKMHCTKAYLTP